MATRNRVGAGLGCALLLFALSLGCEDDSLYAEGRHAQSERDDAATEDREDVRTAPPPDRLSEAQVRAELDELLREEQPMDVPYFQRLLRMIPAAQTPQALQWVVSHAELIARERPGAAARAFRARLERQLEGVLVGPGFASEAQPTAECHVGFDHADALAAMPDAAVHTFSADPHYFHPCRTGFIRFEPLKYGHYHLNFTAPNVCLFSTSPLMFGRLVAGECLEFEDPAQEPRLVGAHFGDQVIRVRYHSGGGLDLPLPFSLRYFVNAGGEPVRIRYRDIHGDWHGWNSLGGYTIWVLDPPAAEVEEMFITHADTSLDCGPDWVTTGGSTCPFGSSPFFVDGFGIDP